MSILVIINLIFLGAIVSQIFYIFYIYIRGFSAEIKSIIRPIWNFVGPIVICIGLMFCIIGIPILTFNILDKNKTKNKNILNEQYEIAVQQNAK